MSQKWEYLTEVVGSDDLNARGQDGWRLVAVAGGVMFYERPIIDEADTAAEVKPTHSRARSA